MENNIRVFFELVKAGLWRNGNPEIRIEGITDWKEVYRLATEQSVLGLILAGLEHSVVKPPQALLLQWIGEVHIIEQTNKTLNQFVAELVEKMRAADIYTILVKGQGIAQCYDNPLWRASGDIDLLLSDTNYKKAKCFLIPQAADVDEEYKTFKHLGMTMPGDYVIELHGTLHSRLSARIDKVIDDAQNDVFYGGSVRSWQNGKIHVFLPGPNNDVIFVFTHILHHFYIEGIGLRQICDWCRLLWTYRTTLNRGILESRIREAGLMSEWLAFAALAVDYLGMPVEAMPMYSSDKKWSRKANRIIAFVLECGNFGHNRVFNRSQNYLIGKAQALCLKLRDFVRHARIFPLDSMTFFLHYFMNGILIAKEIKQREN